MTPIMTETDVEQAALDWLRELGYTSDRAKTTSLVDIM